MPTRDYDALARDLSRSIPPDASNEQRMRAVVDALWDALHPTGVSWLGFYVDAGDGQHLNLAARRDKPACSPLGLHGACGQCFLAKTSLVVRDVADLGPNYIACDPRDRSEVVVPCLLPDGEAWGVLDVDSHDLASFSDDAPPASPTCSKPSAFQRPQNANGASPGGPPPLVDVFGRSRALKCAHPAQAASRHRPGLVLG